MVPGGLDGERELLRPRLRQGTTGNSEEWILPGWLARERQLLHSLRHSPMKRTTKIRFTEPQIALVMRAHPNCNLDRLAEISFEFDQAGKIIDCIGTIKDGGNIDRDYARRRTCVLVREGTPPIGNSTNQRNDFGISKRQEKKRRLTTTNPNQAG
jgi:hypothetical protein